MNVEVLVHETIHAISNFDGSDGSHRTGFHCDFLKHTSNYMPVYFHENIGINEGFTQFFATKFLNIKNECAYLTEVNIAEILSSVCGYEEVKELYFNNDIAGLKQLIKDKYHLQDSALINKLFSQMDTMVNTASLFRIHEGSFVKNCYETLLQMEINRRSVEAGKGVKLTQDEIQDYLNKHMHSYVGDNLAYIESIISNKDALYKKDNSNKHNVGFYRDLTANVVDALIYDDKIKLFMYKNKLKANSLDVLRMLNHDVIFVKGGESLNNYEIVDMYLNMLHDKNGKIRLDHFNDREKYEFMAITMFGPYSSSKTCYQHFYAKDLISLINNDLDEYKAFLDRGPLEYIYTEIDKINPKIRNKDSFNRCYQVVKQDCGGYLDLMQNIKR